MSTSARTTEARRPQPAGTPPASSGRVPWLKEHEYTLLRHVAAGDTAAFEQLYHHYAPRLSAFLRRRLGQPEMVEEVLNEVMFVVWRRAAAFRPPTNVSTWLFGIARYKVYKARARCQQFAPEERPMAEIGSNEDNPEQRLWLCERHHLVTHAVASLPPEQRTVVELTYYHTYSSREIAQHLDAAEPTVRTRLRLARQRLAQRLERLGLGPVAPTPAEGVGSPHTTTPQPRTGRYGVGIGEPPGQA